MPAHKKLYPRRKMFTVRINENEELKVSQLIKAGVNVSEMFRDMLDEEWKKINDRRI